MCMSQGMANWIDPGGMFASKAMQQVAGDSPVGTALQGVTGLGGTMKAYNKFMVPKDPPPLTPVNTSGSLTVTSAAPQAPSSVAPAASRSSGISSNSNLMIPQFAPQQTTPGLNIPA